MMQALLNKISRTYYLKRVKEEDSNILHYKRNPTWRSLVLFSVLFGLMYYISSQSPYFYIKIFCYIFGTYFCYLSTEKYEEVVFDKSKGTVSIMNSRFLEKHLLGYRRKIVTELSSIVAVSVESQKLSPGKGYMVVLLLFSGMTLSLTVQCTFGDKQEHEEIAKEIRKFLKTIISQNDWNEKED